MRPSSWPEVTENGPQSGLRKTRKGSHSPRELLLTPPHLPESRGNGVTRTWSLRVSAWFPWVLAPCSGDRDKRQLKLWSERKESLSSLTSEGQVLNWVTWHPPAVSCLVIVGFWSWRPDHRIWGRRKDGVVPVQEWECTLGGPGSKHCPLMGTVSSWQDQELVVLG